MTRTPATTATEGTGPAAAPAAAPDRRPLDERAERWERRLAVPVIVAAIVAVPAVFLTTLEPRPVQIAGHALNWASLAVLAGETGLLLFLARDRLAWLRRHRWTILIVVVAVPAVAFAIAPVQALRLLKLLRLVGTLRILRARTILKAGHTIARRFSLRGPWKHLLVSTAALLSAGFVALVLADPTAGRHHREVFATVAGWRGTVPVLVAGALLAVATFVLVRNRRD